MSYHCSVSQVCTQTNKIEWRDQYCSLFKL